MTQVELAARLKVTPQQIQHYLNEDFTKRRIMTLQTAINVAAILHCQVEDLYELIEVGPNE